MTQYSVYYGHLIHLLLVYVCSAVLLHLLPLTNTASLQASKRLLNEEISEGPATADISLRYGLSYEGQIHTMDIHISFTTISHNPPQTCPERNQSRCCAKAPNAYVPRRASQPFLIPGDATLVPLSHKAAQPSRWRLRYKVSVSPCTSCKFVSHLVHPSIAVKLPFLH